MGHSCLYIGAMRIPIELKLKYLYRRIQDLNGLKFSLEKNDFSVAMRVGHQIKGNAPTFGVPSISLIGFEMEMAAKNRDKKLVILLADQLEILIKQNLGMHSDREG